MRHLPILAAALLAAGCRMPATEPAPERSAERLMQGCAETERLLGQMKSAEPSFTFDEEGNARMERRLWTAIPTAMQDGLINAIAYRAICKRGDLGEQVVTIRASENNEILAQETVTEFNR